MVLQRRYRHLDFWRSQEQYKPNIVTIDMIIEGERYICVRVISCHVE
jgi:hypothetical protein